MKKTLVSALTTALVVGAASTTFAAANPFEDVPADHWAYDAIAQLAADGVIEGYGDGTYRGDQEITRYEMAQMIARAMAKGGGDKALIDKLAAEFADELNNLGVRVAALEKKVDNVKWGGRIRYRYIHMNHEGGAADGWGNGTDDRRNINEIRLRFEPQMKINEHWTGKARLDYYHGTNMNDARNETNNGDFVVDRIFVTGDYKNLQINLGKMGYKTQADGGLLVNRTMSGGQAIFGDDIKVSLAMGRMNNDYNKIGTEYARRANSYGNLRTAGVDADAASTYGAIEIYNNRKNKFTWGIGYHRIGNRDFERYAGMDSDNISILGLGLGYKFTPMVRLNAAWTHAFGAGFTDVTKNQVINPVTGETRGDIEGSQKNSYVIQLEYGGADAKKVNSWGAYVAWRQIGQVSSMGWNEYALTGPQYAGSRGFEIGASWAPMKNVVGSLKWFTGKDMKFAAGDNLDNNEKVNTIFTEWSFIF